ncbi:MOSC domain-containing protein [Paenibacillus thailandensis]|uniref:MOSC domain-containing protein n=1 Tax=Paenibacillus thailandensis TaxID=393250 RepID=A0ABW5QTN8_9BACL
MPVVGNETKIISLQVGRPAPVMHGSKQVETAIFKRVSTEKHWLGVDGLEGDGQADTVHHGGPDKAVCAYFEARYPYWKEWLGRDVENGSFGENFTLSGWTEEDLCIGDIVQNGQITLQVSQPRVPCFKLGIRNEEPRIVAESQQTGYTGFYFRVLQEGEVQAGDRLALVERHPAGISIAEANRIMHVDKNDRAGIEALLAVGELAAAWRDTLEARLERLTGGGKLGSNG